MRIGGAKKWRGLDRLISVPIYKASTSRRNSKHLRRQTATDTRWRKSVIYRVETQQVRQYGRLHPARPTSESRAAAKDLMSLHLGQRLAHNWSCKDDLTRETFHPKLNICSNDCLKKSWQIFAASSVLGRNAAFCRLNEHKVFLGVKRKLWKTRFWILEYFTMTICFNFY